MDEKVEDTVKRLEYIITIRDETIKELETRANTYQKELIKMTQETQCVYVYCEHCKPEK